MNVTELMDLPDTGGLDDEIGGHVRPAESVPEGYCRTCETELELVDDVDAPIPVRDGYEFRECPDDDCWSKGVSKPVEGAE